MPTYRWTDRTDMERIISLAKWFGQEFKKETGCDAELDDFLEYVEGHPSGVNWPDVG